MTGERTGGIQPGWTITGDRGRLSPIFQPVLLRMWGDIDQLVRVALDPEIEAPPLIHPRLPEVTGFIVFLGAQGRMAEILEKELKFPVKRSLDGWGRGGVALDEALREARAH